MSQNTAVQSGEESADVEQIFSRLAELLEFIDAEHMFEIIVDETG